MTASNGINRQLMALRIAKEIQDGMAVNLGVGIPFHIPDLLPDGLEVFLHVEQGIIGYGRTLDPYDSRCDEDHDVMGSYREILPGASIVDHAQSFAIVRGGHIDIAVLGAFQVAANGDLASHIAPNMLAGGAGGAPDIARGARRLIIAMEHTTPAGEPRLLPSCTYPVTAVNCVDTVVTNFGVFYPRGDHFYVSEIAPGVSADELQLLTEAPLVGVDSASVLEF